MKIIKNNLFMLKIYLQKVPVYLIMAIVNTTLKAVIPVYNLYVIKNIINILTKSNAKIQDVFILLIPFGALSLLSTVFEIWFTNQYSVKVSLSLQKYMQIKTFDIVSNIDLIDYDQKEFYDKYVKAIAEIDVRAKSVVDTIIQLYGCLLTISTMIGLVYTIDPIIFLFCFFGVLLTVAVSSKNVTISFLFNQKLLLVNRSIDYLKRIFYLPQYAKDIKTNSLPDMVKQKYSNEMRHYTELNMNLASKRIFINSISGISTILLNIGLVAYLSIKIILKLLTVGDFLTLMSAGQSLTSYISNLFNIFPLLQQHSLYIDNILDFWNYKGKIENTKGGDSVLIGRPPKIKLHNVYFQYNLETPLVLKNINLSINSGETIALVGPNGAGKSTFVKLLQHLYEPTSGNIEYDNRRYECYNVHLLRKNIGVVFQDYQYYAFSIAENILLHPLLSEEDKEIVYLSLKRVGLYDKIIHLENGINTNLTREFDENGIVLSGGEMQKLALARVFANNYGLVILDEPTSNIDPISESEIYNIIMNTFKEKTVIIISHRLSVTNLVDKVCFLENGMVTEFGTHEELMTKKGKYYSMFKLQAEKYNSRSAIYD